eukprot:CAMPEP_0117435230 /NCGR_PEP_ID=MMETSP0759-20121206/369_1 /TAXON_ID=63605 /ORGANISM="Percolomonas cosmopolitus, Strain WS" /LENGTH=1199 /DNA_ID=CAMNT_0005226761 /DNA_START=151 /DNA_END=3750 /DNA_ORIENTATION=+
MYIQEIILDGFKSYASKTVLKDFDKHFNAITGFNGSGKSNIFDAICFVMGLTKLKHVRVSNLEGLIYKSGQAQITKASVSIVFDNSDLSKSPKSFEKEKKITVTRQIVASTKKNKFIINGKTAQLNQVHNLFESVQLNINNPHFLVMQGKITKILGMKPTEVLGMIQEAAGTSTYERHKIKCQQKIAKKEQRLKEVQNILDTEIGPAMQKAEESRKKRARLSTIEDRIAHLEKQLDVAMYLTATAFIHSSGNQGDKLKEAIKTDKDKIVDIDQEIEILKAEILEIRSHRGVDQKLRQEEEQLNSLNSERSKKKVDWTYSTKTLREEQEALQTKKNELVQKSTEIKQLQRDFEKTKVQLEAKSDQKDQCRNRVTNLQCALRGDGEGITASSTEELMRCNTNIHKAASQISISKTRIQSCKENIQKNEKKLVSDKMEYDKLQGHIQQLEQELEQLKLSQKQSTFSRDDFDKLLRERSSIERAIEGARREADQSARQNHALRTVQEWEGKISDQIKGPLITLFKSREAKYNLALGSFVGNSLMSIVTDNDETAQRLLAQMRGRRVHVMPMNRMRSNLLNRQSIDAAHRLGAHHALELIEFNPIMQRIMEHVFGSFFVCDSVEIAEKVCNDRSIRATGAVSLDGSVYRSGGTLSGGYHASSSDSITQYQQFREARDKYRKLKQQHQQTQNQIDSMQQEKRRHDEFDNRAQTKAHELRLEKEAFAQANYKTCLANIERYKNTLDDEQQNLETYEQKKKSNEERAEQLKSEIQSLERGVQDRAKAEKELKDAQSKSNAAQKAYDRISEQVNMLEANIEECQQEIEQLTSTIARNESDLAKLHASHEEITQSFEKITAQVREHERAINSRKHEIKESEKELLNKQDKQTNLGKRKIEIESSIKNHENRLKHLEDRADKAKRRINALRSEHPEIGADARRVGDDTIDEKTIKTELDTLQKEKEKLQSTVSTGPMQDHEENEKKHRELIEKKEKILADRAGIEESIQHWDDAKNKAILSTFEKVNEDFGQIFSDLLPNTKAKLVQVNPNDIMEGIEFRVAFGNVWKESLMELSGGQRSLLGLSLILAFLRCKPAPLYILDEIDAALDPSHTQNIGLMLQRRFKNAQFIVISLKQGMFQNANVIFRTKLQQGQSSVERTEPTVEEKNAMARELESDDKENRSEAVQQLSSKSSGSGGKKRKRGEGRTHV